MARLPRLAIADHVHLLLQRGRSGQAVFVTADDAHSYLRALHAAAEQTGVAVHAYALSVDEAVMLVTPASANSLARMIQSLGRRFAGEYNRRHGSSGSPWDGRFRSTVIDPAEHLLDCLCFVEWPANAADRPFSSAAHHIGQRHDPLITAHAGYWRLGNTPFEREAAHRELLSRGLPPETESKIRDALVKGWALGDTSFVAGLSGYTRRRARPLARGRPPAPQDRTTMSPIKITR